MGRIGSYPTTIEDCLTISIKKLKEWNYLNVGTKAGTINWSRNGIEHSSISILVNNTETGFYIILDYKANGEPIKYKIDIKSKSSNLGKGEILYFVCPSTGKYCRNLYLMNSYFLHREAFNNLYYEKQLESKKSRYLFKIFNRAYLKDEVYEQRYSKYFKTHYNGLPTKRYLKLENLIRISESYPSDIINSLMLM